MTTVPRPRPPREVDYPSGDGKPVAETELHLLDLIDIILLLKDYFAARPNVYVGGNLLLYYEEGNPRKHVAPDVLVALNVPKQPNRDYYLVWKEKKAPDFVVEITSKSTKKEDMKTKFGIYRDILKVSEYFLFDPRAEYLKPPLQGFRLVAGEYVPIEPIAGRLPSGVLGLHLERDGEQLRLFDPASGQRLLTRLEGRAAAADRAAAAERRTKAAERRIKAAERSAKAAERSAKAAERSAKAADDRAAAAEAAEQRLAEENERLRREIEALRGG
jgi:Uma2 family endonuclease